MVKKQIVYVGYSEYMIQCILDTSWMQLKAVITVEKRVNAVFLQMVKEQGIELICVNNADEARKAISRFSESYLFIMYKFEYIIPQDIVEKYCIINFHGGNLRTNRGAHAVVWSILKREKETKLSMYKVAEGIDVGLLIGEYTVSINENDTVDTLNAKLREGIPLLLEYLHEFLLHKREGEMLTSGVYRLKVTPKDYTIDLESDTIQDICAKINSQKGYNGAICWINGEEKRVIGYDLCELEDTTVNTTVVAPHILNVVKDNKMLKLYLKM